MRLEMKFPCFVSCESHGAEDATRNPFPPKLLDGNMLAAWDMSSSLR